MKAKNSDFARGLPQGALGIVGALLGQGSQGGPVPTAAVPCGQRVASTPTNTQVPAQPGQIPSQPTQPAQNDPAGAIKGLFKGLLGGSKQ